MYQSITTSDQRAAFSDGDLSTASPTRVLIKCFDRLDADLDRALAAIEADDHETANAQLSHAQDLLGEVAGMLDTEAWQHADALLAVYDYVLRMMAMGNMRKDAAAVAEARRILAEIGDGFRGAATEIESGSAQPPVPTDATKPAAVAAGAFGASVSPAPARVPTSASSGFSALA